MTGFTRPLRARAGASASLAARAFAEWLVWLPPGIDLRDAARAQIAAIDRRAVQHPDVEFLRTLLTAMAGGSAAGADHRPRLSLQ